MDAIVIVSNMGTDIINENIVKNIENKHNFSYVDKNNNKCEIWIDDSGIRIFEQAIDYSLNLMLNGEDCAIVKTNEGDLKILIKIVDFIRNDDILVMRYQIEDEAYELRIIYRS